MSEIHLKHGVNVTGLQPEMVLALMVVHSHYAKIKKACVITSGLDGVHSENSLHYVGRALDFRTRHIDTVGQRKALTKRIAKALGDEYDVIFEGDHIHVEHDP